MNKYLLEIGTEELAYKFIPSAMEQLKNEFSKTLEENEIKFSDIKVYATPRRLAVIIENIAEKQEDIEKTIKGPIANIAYDENGNLTKAAIGFANKNGINPEKLYKQDNYVWAKIEQKGKDTKELLKSAVPNIILKLKGTHFMRWADLDIKFQRPIRWIVSLFNEEKVEVEIANIKSSNITRGHRFSKTEIEIKNPDEYLTVLESAKVIADVQKRKETIVKLAKEKAKEIGAEIAIDEDLLDEVTFITEWPVPVICSFEEKYLQIPEKVVVTVMAVHQRYFPLYKEGKLLNKFITISNYVGDTFENIKAGNERVVKARLEDAIFFVQEDTQKPLLSYLEALKGVTFQKGFGSVYDKTQRICELSKQIAKDLNIPTQTIERTALLCKADLVTKLVFEFTELQGFIGADYARVSGEEADVCEGIKEHYFPLNAESETAKSIEGQVVGIADKTDTICAVFVSGKKPTGSSDPLGVRRAALGIIKTIIEHNLKLDLSKLIDDALELLPIKADVKKEIEEFFVQRLIIFLNNEYSKNTLEACAEINPCHDLCDYVKRVNAVSAGVDERLIENANRVLRILKDDISECVDESLFTEPAEKDLYKAICGIKFEGDYKKYLQELTSINPVVTKFFDDVLVMDKDEKVKTNRLALLNSLKNKYIILTDFSKL